MKDITVKAGISVPVMNLLQTTIALHVSDT